MKKEQIKEARLKSEELATKRGLEIIDECGEKLANGIIAGEYLVNLGLALSATGVAQLAMIDKDEAKDLWERRLETTNEGLEEEIFDK